MIKLIVIISFNIYTHHSIKLQSLINPHLTQMNTPRSMTADVTCATVKITSITCLGHVQHQDDVIDTISLRPYANHVRFVFTFHRTCTCRDPLYYRCVFVGFV